MISVMSIRNTSELNIGDIVIGIPKSDLLCKFGKENRLRRAGVEALLFKEGKIILYDLDDGHHFYWDMDIEPSVDDEYWACFVYD